MHCKQHYIPLHLHDKEKQHQAKDAVVCTMLCQVIQDVIFNRNSNIKIQTILNKQWTREKTTVVHSWVIVFSLRQ